MVDAGYAESCASGLTSGGLFGSLRQRARNGFVGAELLEAKAGRAEIAGRVDDSFELRQRHLEGHDALRRCGLLRLFRLLGSHVRGSSLEGRPGSVVQELLEIEGLELERAEVGELVADGGDPPA